MEKIAAAAAAVALLLVVLPCSRAADHIVGDSTGWTTNQNYSSWATGKTFGVGDTLTFNYGSSHDVLEVSKASYDSCNAGNPISTNSATPTVITLNKTGEWYFICGSPNHCSGGNMKLAVNVTGSSSTPSPPGTPSPSGSPPATNSTPPSSSAGYGLAVGTIGVEMAVAFAGLVMFWA